MSISLTTIEVPVIYDVYGILFKKRTVSRVPVHGVVSIQVKSAQASDVKEAFHIKVDGAVRTIVAIDGVLYHKKDGFSADDLLLRSERELDFYQGVYSQTLKADLKNFEREAGCFTDGRHFRFRDGDKPISGSELDAVGFREIIADSRGLLERAHQSYVDHFVLVDDGVFVRCGEPYFYVHTYGAGFYSSGFIRVCVATTDLGGNVLKSHVGNFYSALHYEDALSRARQKARLEGRQFDAAHDSILVHDTSLVKLDGCVESLYIIRGDESLRNFVFKRESEAAVFIASQRGARKHKLSYEKVSVAEFNALTVLDCYMDDKTQMGAFIFMIHECESPDAVYEQINKCRKVSFVNKEYIARLFGVMSAYKAEQGGSLESFEIPRYADFLSDVESEIRSLDNTPNTLIGMVV